MVELKEAKSQLEPSSLFERTLTCDRQTDTGL